MQQRLHETIHTLRSKPQHVRENIALGIAGGITLVVAAGWLFATVQSDTFAIGPSAQPGSVNVTEAVSSTRSNFSQLLGAAGAAVGATTTPPSITIVDTEVRTTLDAPEVPPDATVIHF